MDEQSTAAQSGGSDGFSSILNGILSNPEMMAMISSMAGKLKSENAPAESEATEVSEASPTSAPERLPEAISALAPLLSGEGVKHSKRDNDRACLLRALKPYLSPGRSEAIDYIIKFSSIADLLKNLS
ncbi:MAG: hypothetical protein II292_01935 [Clostridia bacterium]|nr:hypothetical protein [Clostridia bacterium]